MHAMMTIYTKWKLLAILKYHTSNSRRTTKDGLKNIDFQKNLVILYSFCSKSYKIFICLESLRKH